MVSHSFIVGAKKGYPTKKIAKVENKHYPGKASTRKTFIRALLHDAPHLGSARRSTAQRGGVKSRQVYQSVALCMGLRLVCLWRAAEPNRAGAARPLVMIGPADGAGIALPGKGAELATNTYTGKVARAYT